MLRKKKKNKNKNKETRCVVGHKKRREKEKERNGVVSLFVIFYVVSYLASFLNRATVKGNNLNDLISKGQNEPSTKCILVFSVV